MNHIFIGNLTTDPELRYTNNGVPVANISIAVNERTYNKTTGQYEDGETTWVKGTLWRDQAENAATLTKGTRVIAVGKLRNPSVYQTATGENRASIEIDIDELATSIRYATVTVTRTIKQPAPTTNADAWAATPTPPAAAAVIDPWATNPNENPF